MSDRIQVEKIAIENCAPDCDCQSVHILFLDGQDNVIAAACYLPTVAREFAADLIRKADLADAAQIRIEGRLP